MRSVPHLLPAGYSQNCQCRAPSIQYNIGFHYRWLSPQFAVIGRTGKVPGCVSRFSRCNVLVGLAAGKAAFYRLLAHCWSDSGTQLHKLHFRNSKSFFLGNNDGGDRSPDSISPAANPLNCTEKSLPRYCLKYLIRGLRQSLLSIIISLIDKGGYSVKYFLWAGQNFSSYLFSILAP